MIRDIQVVVEPHEGKAKEVGNLLRQTSLVMDPPTGQEKKFSFLYPVGEGLDLIHSLESLATVTLMDKGEVVSKAEVKVPKDFSVEGGEGTLVALLAGQGLMVSELVHTAVGTMSGNKLSVQVWYKGF